ncbi:hypothetical protein PybrP1_006315 [[Pythium] brassicae (nom. inval.)]|nr:hypothetical protein PybrP1_006315 [[Pythium] brassicae (nom. inval.)]
MQETHPHGESDDDDSVAEPLPVAAAAAAESNEEHDSDVDSEGQQAEDDDDTGDDDRSALQKAARAGIHLLEENSQLTEEVQHLQQQIAHCQHHARELQRTLRERDEHVEQLAQHLREAICENCGVLAELSRAKEQLADAQTVIAQLQTQEQRSPRRPDTSKRMRLHDWLTNAIRSTGRRKPLYLPDLSDEIASGFETLVVPILLAKFGVGVHVEKRLRNVVVTDLKLHIVQTDSEKAKACLQRISRSLLWIVDVEAAQVEESEWMRNFSRKKAARTCLGHFGE